MPFFEDDSCECPYSQLLRELDEAYSSVLDDRRDETYHRPKSVFLETSRNDNALARVPRRSSSCEPKRTTIQWRDETEEYEAAVKPAQRFRRNTTSPKETSDGTKKSVASFKRCLRLLGLSPTDLGLIETPDNSENCTPSTPRRRCCTPRPRLSTRLSRKSVSLDDVRKATPFMLSDADAHRLVANAVYEKWYFEKQREILRKKREEEEEERRKAEKKAMEKEELRRKSEEKFHEWLQRKLQQKRQSQIKRATSAPLSDRRWYESRQGVTPEQAAEAYHKWVQEKERQKRQDKNAGAGAAGNRRQPDPQRREEALKVYQHWKKEVDANRKKEQAEKRRKQEEEESTKRQKEQEKVEDARRCFQHWKSRKEREIREQQERRRIAELGAKQREQQKKWHRSETASKAFLDWLDAVDQRTLRDNTHLHKCIFNQN